MLPEFEGNGIGGKLMDFAEAWLWSTGCTRAWLTTDTDITFRAYGFYRKRGWLDWKVEDGVRWLELFAPNYNSSPRHNSDRSPRSRLRRK